MIEIPHILVADDDSLIRMTLEAGLSLRGFRVSLARSGREAIASVREHSFDAVIYDIYMPGGLEVVRELHTTYPNLPVILMTAQGEPDTAARAVAEGATDVIAKPFEIAALSALLQRHLRARREAQIQTPSDDDSVPDLSRSGLIGRSAAMMTVYKLVAHAARTDTAVLIIGESGTGKELTARAIHNFSERKSKPFIAVNCSGLTDTLLEAELFGYNKGAFTGADTDRSGLFEAADGGTLFLDELASTSPSFQAGLLRVLQSGEVRRAGSAQALSVDVRVIGASHAPLRELAETGVFRSDLFYRLSVLNIDLPSLRERTGDVELLAKHFLLKNSAGAQTPPMLSHEVIEALHNYHYPGNVRELENALKRAAALCTKGLITLECLPDHIAQKNRIQEVMPEPVDALRSLAVDWPTLEELQRRYLVLALDKVKGNRQQAADLLGIARRTIQRLIARYGLGAPGESDVIADDDASEDATGNDSQTGLLNN